MLNQTIAYITFLLRSTNQHGVHSPFVYKLITQCFYDETAQQSATLIASFYKKLTKNKLKIKATTSGSCSGVLETNSPSISKIAKSIGASKKQTKLVFRFVNYYQSNSILELGTALGIATYAMSLGHPEAKITTIGGCPNLAAFTEKTLKQFNLKNSTILTGDIGKIIKQLTKSHYDLIYFNSNQEEQAVLDHFKTLLATVTNDSVFIFDAIYRSKYRTAAWNTIRNHPQVTVSIDTFFLGFVFFRKEQAKEHFTIRV